MDCTNQSLAMRSMPAAAIALAVLVLSTGIGAQSKAPVTRADYGQWESLSTSPTRGGLSPDGAWLAYGINRSNRNNELRFTRIADSTTTVAAFGAQPSFSADSKWLAYSIGLSESQQEKLRRDKKPIHNKLGLVELATLQTMTVDAVESFTYNASGSHLLMRRYAPERPARPDSAPAAGASDDEPPVGTTILVRHLASGRDTSFGNVSELAWQDKGRLLALAIAAEDKSGNGVHLFDPETAVLRVLDSSASIYSGLAWRKESADLAVLRAKSDDRREGPTHVALAWTNLGESNEGRHVYDPAADGGFPAGMRTVSYRRPTWSDDGRTVFVGLSKWEEKIGDPKPAAPTEPGRTGDAGQSPNGAEPPAQRAQQARTDPDEDEPATVDVWHARDVDVMAKQKLSATADRRRNLLAAWHLGESSTRTGGNNLTPVAISGQLVQLGTEPTEQVTPVKRQKLAYAAQWTAYAMDRSIGRPAADLDLIDVTTGRRTRLKDRVDDRYVQVSPGGHYLLFFQDDHYWTIDLASRAIVNLTKGAATSFVDRESDASVKQKPPFGVAGWTKNDAAVVLYDKLDLWRIASDGSRSERLTDGAVRLDQVRHRYVRLNPEDEWIDTERPIYLSLFGLWSKRSGYARLQPGAAGPDRLVWLEKSVGAIARAKDADVFSYVVQAFDDPPDVFVSGADLKDSKQVTRTNPFQDRFAWGRSEVIDFKSGRGERLQGSLAYPAAYEPGKRYPMIVYMYERLSDQVHRYVSPSEREPYNPAVFTSLGYFVLQPDIVFRPRDPGLSAVECVGPAVKAVVDKGLVDPKRVGSVGHSWGGFDTTFLATHTDLFAAAVAGAPITNLVSNYGNHHWSSGIAETDHIETGQQRMEVPLWDDLPAYIRNSAVFNVQNMKTPLLIEVGDSDGTVFWHQGVELYNIARRAKKDVVLLVYAGEDHGLRKKPNQLDYHRRIVEWFGHYLKDEPAQPWIKSGVSYLEREQELKRLKAKKGKSGT